MRLPADTVRRCTECGATATEAWWQAPGCAGVARCDDHPPAVRRWDLPSLGVPLVIDGPEVFTGSLDTESCRFTGEYAQQATDDRATDLTLAEQLRKMIATLTMREEKVIRMMYGIGEPECGVDDIAADFNLSPSRIMQMANKAIRKLRHPSRAKKIAAFTDLSIASLSTLSRKEQPRRSDPVDAKVAKQRLADYEAHRAEIVRSERSAARFRDRVEMPPAWIRIYVYEPTGRTRFQIMRSSPSPFGRFVATWTPPVLRNPLHAECATLPTGIAPKPRPPFAFRSPA